MKFTLQNSAGALVGFALMAALSLGLSGGPNYGGGGKTSVVVTGTYSGVLKPVSCTTVSPAPSPAPSATPTGRCGANSVGIFSLTIPSSGTGTGTVVVFDRGQAYNGTLQATANPLSGALDALLNGTFIYQDQVLASTVINKDGTVTNTYVTQSFAATAVGQMNAKLRTRSGISSIVKLKGTADVQFSLVVNRPFDDIAYNVSGYKQ